MIHNYQKRVVSFIDRVARKPVEKGDEYSKKLETDQQEFNKSKVVGDSFFRHTYKVETHRTKVWLC